MYTRLTRQHAYLIEGVNYEGVHARRELRGSHDDGITQYRRNRDATQS